MSTKKKSTSKSAYQVHISAQKVDKTNVVDFSEYKLRRIIAIITDARQKQFLIRMLSDYLAGKILIAWEDGIIPFYTSLKRPKK